LVAASDHVAEERFGMNVVVQKRTGHHLHDVLVELHVVAHAGQGLIPQVDLALPRRGDLVVVHLDVDARFLQFEHQLAPEILQAVRRRHREVALFVPWLMTEVRLLVTAGVPGSLGAVDTVERLVGRLVVADVVEHEELGPPEVDGRCDAALLDVRFGLLRHEPGVARVPAAGDRIVNIAGDQHRRDPAHRINGCGRRVGNQEHVALVDVLEAADAAAVETDALREEVGGELLDGEREVLRHPEQIAEPEVHDLDALLLRHLDHTCRTGR
jgi:hypothetical protein